MKIHLHIGTDKTGSTSLEAALWRNRDWLRTQSLYLPHTGFGRDNGHAALLEKLPTEGLRDLTTELAQARDSGMHAALLSWEGMCRYRRSEIRRLRLALQDFDIQVLVYLREQAELIQSAHLQWIKMNAGARSLRRIMRPSGPAQALYNAAFLRHPRRNYYRLLRRWQRLLPQAGFTLRVFDPHTLYRGDVICDCLQQLGIEPDEHFVTTAAPSNPSMDVEGALLIQAWREDPSCRDQLATLIDVMQAVVNHRGSQTRHFLDRSQVDALRKHFRPSNQRLARHFMPGTKDPFPPARACWRTDSLEQIEQRCRTLAGQVREVNTVPTLSGGASGTDLAAKVELCEGWSEIEEWGIWAVGERSRLRFRLSGNSLAPGVEAVRIALRGHCFAGVRCESLTINDLAFDSSDPTFAAREFTLPVSAMRDYQVVDICLHHLRDSRRHSEEEPDEQRELSFALSGIEIEPVWSN